jgi:nickel/cobalt exporter
VNLGHGFVELTVFETDVPRFRLFLYDKRKQARPVPKNATITIETVRRDDTRQTFDFHVKGDCLESTTGVPEPHEFKAIVHVTHGSHTHTHEVHVSDRDGVSGVNRSERGSR